MPITEAVRNIFGLIAEVKITVMVILFIVIKMIDLFPFWYRPTPCKVNQLMDFHMLPMYIDSVITVMIDIVF